MACLSEKESSRRADASGDLASIYCRCLKSSFGSPHFFKLTSAADHVTWKMTVVVVRLSWQLMLHIALVMRCRNLLKL